MHRSDSDMQSTIISKMLTDNVIYVFYQNM